MEFTAVLTANPDMAAAFFELGQVYARMGKNGAAAAAYREVAAINPYVGNVNTRLGEMALADNKLDSAIAYLKKALERDTEPFMIYFQLANAYQKRGDLPEAADAYKQVIKLFPVLFDARYNLGMVYSKQKRWADAATEFEETLKLNARFSPAHYQLAAVQTKLGKRQDAKQHLQEYLKNAPDGEYVADAKKLLASL
jgi:tetratricopeptide (TPR) repeat protein